MSEQTSTKSLIFEIFKNGKYFRHRLKDNIYMKFFEKYPGVCHFKYGIDDKDVQLNNKMKWEDEGIEHYRYRNIDSTVAPCITGKLCVNPSDPKADYEPEYNIRLSYDNMGRENYLLYDTKLVQERCTESWCETAHYRRVFEITPEHIILREQVNNKVWEYDELLSLWKIFYEKYMDDVFEEKYGKYFIIHEPKLSELIKKCDTYDEKMALLKINVEELIEKLNLW